MDESDSDASSEDMSSKMDREDELEQIMMTKLENKDRNIFKVIRPNTTNNTDIGN